MRDVGAVDRRQEPKGPRAIPVNGAWNSRLAQIATVGSLVVLMLLITTPPASLTTAVAVVALALSVLASVHHAEVLALRIGDPFGTLVLALAVTVIEVALIASLMAGGNSPTLARDAVFAAIMITCNGVVGLCLLAGIRKERVARFQPIGATGSVSVIAILTTLCLILPVYTISAGSDRYSPPQLLFAAFVALFLYGTFVFLQTIRDRDYFLPINRDGELLAPTAPPSTATLRRPSTLALFLLLAIALVCVVGLAKTLSSGVEGFVARIGAPPSVVGIVISGLVLLPESIAAVRSARRDRLQSSMNLAYGSALATIGLTIPVVAIASLVTGAPLILGLSATEQILLLLTIFSSALTVVQGRASALQAVVHLALLTTFAFLAFVP